MADDPHAPLSPALADLERAPHALLDPESRFRKAAKIRGVLSGATSLEGRRVLEIGTGSGATAAVLSEAVGADGTVTAVDVHDLRIATEGYAFCRVAGVELPFADASFDVVVSNHVIEHVGERPAQRRHLEEIRRVLRPAGLAYVAAPNRWRLVEPHFRLPFLSWFPHSWASRYVRAARKGDYYDCVPPSYRTIESLFADAGLASREVTYEAMRVMLDVEEPRGLAKAALRVPRAVFRLARPAIPTMIFLAWRA